MEIAKALILAGRRRDDRPLPTAPWASEHLFPVANRPILIHNLEALRAAGLLEATIMADPEASAAIERAVGDGSDWGLTIRYAEYAPAGGLAGALSVGRKFLGGEPVLVQEGDALLCERIYPHLAAFAREGLDALALQIADRDGRGGEAHVPGYLLSDRAVSILRDGTGAGPNPVARVRALGGRVRVQLVDGWLPCTGDQEMLLECNRQMLEAIEPGIEGAVLIDSTIQGPVIIHPTARLERTLVRGPAIIGPRARLTDAYVGPSTSIGADVVLEGAEIEYSIVLDGAELRYVRRRIESSVIGRNARILSRFSLPRAIQLSIGDCAKVLL